MAKSETTEDTLARYRTIFKNSKYKFVRDIIQKRALALKKTVKGKK